MGALEPRKAEAAEQAVTAQLATDESPKDQEQPIRSGTALPLDELVRIDHAAASNRYRDVLRQGRHRSEYD